MSQITTFAGTTHEVPQEIGNYIDLLIAREINAHRLADRAIAVRNEIENELKNVRTTYTIRIASLNQDLEHKDNELKEAKRDYQQLYEKYTALKTASLEKKVAKKEQGLLFK